MAWISCGLDQAWKLSRVRENYNILHNLRFLSGAKMPCTPTCRGLFEISKWCKDALYTHVSGAVRDWFNWDDIKIQGWQMGHLISKLQATGRDSRHRRCRQPAQQSHVIPCGGGDSGGGHESSPWRYQAIQK